MGSRRPLTHAFPSPSTAMEFADVVSGPAE